MRVVEKRTKIGSPELVAIAWASFHSANSCGTRLHEACSYRTDLVATLELADEQGVRLRDAGEVGIELNNHIDRLADLEEAIPRFTASAFAVSSVEARRWGRTSRLARLAL